MPDLLLDAHGRPTQKVCPECGAVIGRTTRLCGCGHRFIGRQWAQRRAMRESGLKFVPGEPEPKAIEQPVRVIQCEDKDFDCIAEADGLCLRMKTVKVLLTPRQRTIVELEVTHA